MPKIFVNYRTGDTENVAALADRELSRRFGAEVFFRASKSIPGGADYTRELLRAVRQSDVLLAFMGRHWLDAATDGRRKIDEEGDWTRKEILEAFRHDVQVIPVLVGGARPLRPEDLPEPLARLARCQYVRLGHRDMDSGLDMLAAQLVKLVPGLRERSAERPPARGPGIVNSPERGDVNIAVQANDVHGGVRMNDVGLFGGRVSRSSEGER
jgi:hypothetical protein